ncbi:MAG: nucleotidyltransferase domain-containing protein [Burkholderiales bacterium]|nr:nucleotidyltransferase domain-containing protein [Burkholderiales bacterium]
MSDRVEADARGLASYDVERVLTELLAGEASVQFACLFGSAAQRRLRFESDLDVGLASAGGALSPSVLREISARIAERTGRGADVVDLAVAPIPVLRAALANGRRLLCKDRSLVLRLLRRLVYESEDFLPYQRRLLEERRRRWIAT